MRDNDMMSVMVCRMHISMRRLRSNGLPTPTSTRSHLNLLIHVTNENDHHATQSPCMLMRLTHMRDNDMMSVMVCRMHISARRLSSNGWPTSTRPHLELDTYVMNA